MPLFKQCIHFGLILMVSLLMSTVALLLSHNSKWKLLASGRIPVERAGDKATSDSQQKRMDIAKFHQADMREPSDIRSNVAHFNASLDDSRCTPRMSIAFLKMHKCSSSTIQNLLFRYGEEHQLDFVLPPRGNYLGHANNLFHGGVMMKFPVSRYNILCHHTRFSYKGMKEVMSKDAVYTTIIRDPVTMYESLFTYLNMARLYNLPQDKALELFLEKPKLYYAISHGSQCKARNPMLFDLGLDEASLGDKMRIKWTIEQLRRQFDLVMITEYFEESLVLLQHLMCWDTDDMVYFVLNARSKLSVKPVSPDMAAKIRRWNFGDMALYNTFNRTFWRKVEAFGHDRMRREVAKLRERNQYFKDHCIARVISQDSAVWHPPGIEVDSFQLKPEALNDTKCVQMARTELPYSSHIRDMQCSKYGMVIQP